jgi:hypothetical protein
MVRQVLRQAEGDRRGFRAVGGSVTICVNRSVWETSKLNGLKPFDTIRLAFEGWLLRLIGLM